MKPASDAVPDDFAAALQRFHADFPIAKPIGLIVMRFGFTAEHAAVRSALAEISARTGVALLRADHHQYHQQLFENVRVYLHGCAFAISVFEDAEGRGFNPNVALEVGYLQALRKPVLYLQSSSLKHMPADLQGAPRCQYDSEHIDETTLSSIAGWVMQQVSAAKLELRVTSVSTLEAGRGSSRTQARPRSRLAKLVMGSRGIR